MTKGINDRPNLLTKPRSGSGSCCFQRGVPIQNAWTARREVRCWSTSTCAILLFISVKNLVHLQFHSLNNKRLNDHLWIALSEQLSTLNNLAAYKCCFIAELYNRMNSVDSETLDLYQRKRGEGRQQRNENSKCSQSSNQIFYKNVRVAHGSR